MSNNILEVKTIGPVHKLDIPLPPDGGVVVLRGPNGSGKSTVLEAAKRMAGGKSAPLSPTDGERRGTMTMGSAKLSVTPHRTTASGELTVDAIESKFDVSDLIDPGIKDPDRADAARLRALVSLSGAEANEQLYVELCTPEIWARISGDLQASDDPVELCGIVKRAIEEQARSHETRSDELRGRMAAIQELIDDELGDPEDPQKLVAVIDDASRHLTELTNERHSQDEEHARRQKAKEQLAEIEAQQVEPLEVITNRLSDNFTELQALEQRHDELSRQIRELEELQDSVTEQAKRLGSERLTLEQQSTVAKSRDEMIKQLRNTIDGVMPIPITDEDIQEAARNKQQALAAFSANDKAVENRKRKSELGEMTKEKQQHAVAAAQLRKMAKDTENVLVQQIGAGPIRYEQGRLVVETDRSASEPFAELSHGERAKIAIDIAAEHVPENGLIVIRQEVFESLQPANREAIAEHARARGVVILTAAVADGDGITVETIA